MNSRWQTTAKTEPVGKKLAAPKLWAVLEDRGK